MIDRGEYKTFVRTHGQRLKTRVCKVYTSTLDSRLARTFTDDVDIYHGADSIRGKRYRAGLRDDEIHCGFSTMLTLS